MSVLVPFPKKPKEPFRLDGQADRVAGRRTRRLLTTREALVVIMEERKRQDSEELRRYERVLRQKLARETAFVDTLLEAFRVAEIAAPLILKETPDGEGGTLVVRREYRDRKARKLLAMFRCTSRGVVLVAHQMLIVPRGYRANEAA